MAQSPCPEAKPGAIGAGPAPGLSDLKCADFDKAYVERVYAHNTVMIAVATLGIQRGCNKNIRDISGEIRTDRTSENEKLACWYAQMGYGTIPVDYGRVQSISDSLAEPQGDCFDTAYANTMVTLLKQANEAHSTVLGRTGIGELCAFAQFAARKTGDQAFRLERWLGR